MCTCIIQIMAVAVCSEDIIFSPQILGSLGISGCPSCGNVKVYRTEMVVYCTVLYTVQVYRTEMVVNGIFFAEAVTPHRAAAAGAAEDEDSVQWLERSHDKEMDTASPVNAPKYDDFSCFLCVEFVKRRKYFQVSRHLAERFRNLNKFSAGSFDSSQYGD